MGRYAEKRPRLAGRETKKGVREGEIGRVAGQVPGSGEGGPGAVARRGGSSERRGCGSSEGAEAAAVRRRSPAKEAAGN